jgi:spore germination protein (amino acid permease)
MHREEKSMFSNNQKISKRQITRLLIYDITGISTLLLPAMLARIVGKDGIFCIFFALIPAYLFTALMGALQKKMDAPYPVYIRKKSGRAVSSVIFAVYYLYSILLAGYVLYVLSCLIQTSLLKGESYWLICICILALGGYGIMGGMEGRARIYEILFWFLMIPLLLMLLLAARDVNPDYWTPVFSSNLSDFAKGTVLVFLFYLLICFVLFLGAFETKRGDGIKAAKTSLKVAALLNGAVFLITLGMFGEKALQGMQYPVITLMSMVKLPGGFFERQDAFMVAIWFFTIYALVNSSMFYGTEVLKHMIGKKGKKRYVLVTLVLTFLAAAMFYRSAFVLRMGEKYFLYIGIGFVVLIPLLFAIFSRKKSGEVSE